jgi:hypothetical protein
MSCTEPIGRSAKSRSRTSAADAALCGLCATIVISTGGSGAGGGGVVATGGGAERLSANAGSALLSTTGSTNHGKNRRVLSVKTPCY